MRFAFLAILGVSCAPAKPMMLMAPRRIASIANLEPTAHSAAVNGRIAGANPSGLRSRFRSNLRRVDPTVNPAIVRSQDFSGRLHDTLWPTCRASERVVAAGNLL